MLLLLWKSMTAVYDIAAKEVENAKNAPPEKKKLMHQFLGSLKITVLSWCRSHGNLSKVFSNLWGIYDTSPNSNLTSSRIGDICGDNLVMGRTIPSFRMALGMEQEDWKPFRNALDKSDRKKFDDMWDIPRLYTSACSYVAQSSKTIPNSNVYTTSPFQKS